jgi:hypothetical protein
MDNLQDFTNFGTSLYRQISNDEMNNTKNFTMDDFINLPHFDEQSNCLQLIAALKSDDKTKIDKINEEPIIIKEIDPTHITIKYGDIEISFDKYELIKKLEEKASLMESTKNKIKSKKEDSFLSNSIKKFKEFFKINKVVQLQNLKSSDEYKNEHAKGDIYKIQ